MGHFYVNCVTVDWATATTKSVNWFAQVLPANNGKGNGEAFKIRNYWGNVWEAVGDDVSGSVFGGEGVQQGKRHYLIQGTGGQASALFRHLCLVAHTRGKGAYNLTRIDLQCATELEKETTFTGEWLFKNFPSPSTINGSGKEVSLYPQGFGSASHRYWRIYVKKDENTGIHYLRFEIMLRSAVSNGAWELIGNGDLSIGKHDRDVAAVYIHELKRLGERWPKLAELAEYRATMATAEKQSESGFIRVKVGRKSTDTYDWLVKVVGPCMEKFLNSHDTTDIQRKDIKRMIRNLL